MHSKAKHMSASIQQHKAIVYLAKHNMLAIQPWCVSYCDKELGAISIGTGICHAECTRKMSNLEVFVCKLFAIDALAPRPIASAQYFRFSFVLSHTGLSAAQSILR